VNVQEGDEFPDSIVTGDETWGFHHTPESKKAGKKFDDDDEVQEEVMTWFKGLAADFKSRGHRSCFQQLINIWTMPATMLKNKVMYRKFTRSIAFVN